MTESKIQLELKFNSSRNQLDAILSNAQAGEIITAELIENKIRESGFAELQKISKNIELLLLSASQNQPNIFTIAERIDAQVTINVSEDAMIAYLTISPTKGGNLASKMMVLNALKSMHIIKKIETHAIDDAIKKQPVENIIIARGTLPNEPKECSFKSLLPQAKDSKPSIDDKGRVNYLDLHEYTCVNKGTPVMQRIVPEIDNDGYDVYGKIIKAPLPKITPFNPESEGTIVSEKDSNILLADLKGHPVLIENGVKIYDTLTLPAVNLTTGNVIFDGPLHITGDVQANMRVDTTGNILIDGIVNAAEITSLGDIEIKQGILGGKEKGASLIATGNISAYFIDNAHVISQGDIIAKEYISHSKVTCQGKIILNQDGGKGNIFGGNLYAKLGVSAKIIGSTAFTPTDISTGKLKSLMDKLQENQEQIMARNNEFAKIKQVVYRVNQTLKEITKPKDLKILRDLIQTSKPALEKLVREISFLQKEKQELQNRLQGAENAYIEFTNVLYGGVNLTIHNNSLKITDETNKGKFICVEDKIIKQSLDD